MNKYWKKIEDYLRDRPGKYVKIDNIRVGLLVNCKRSTLFDRAWRDLVAGGRIELCGNELRINQ